MKNNSLKTNKIKLIGDLNLKSVETVKTQLLKSLKTQYNTEIEFNNLEKWDLAGFQLIYSLKNHFHLNNKTISFKFNPEEISDKSKELLALLNINL